MVLHFVASIPKQVCKITADYESLLNLSRSGRTLSEFVIEAPQMIALVVNPVFEKFSEMFNVTLTTLSGEHLNFLKPFAKAVKYGRDYLNFFELALVLRKTHEMWHDPNVSMLKHISNFFTIPQKLFESFLLIPNNFEVMDLGKWCVRVGRWAYSNFDKNSWAKELFSVNGVFCVKEVFALGASVFNFAAYWKEYRDMQVKMHKKMERMTTHLTPLKNAADKVNSDPASFEALGQLLTTFNAQANQRHTGHQTLYDIEQKLIELHADENKKQAFELMTYRYIRRFILAKDAQRIPLHLPAHIPNSVRHKIQSIYRQFPTPEERLKRVLTYKHEKSRLDNQRTDITLKKDTLGWWYEISKMTIITLGLFSVACALPPLACALAPYVTAATLCKMGIWIGFGGWWAKLFIGGVGLYRSFYMAFVIREEEENVKRSMPNPRLVFAL